MRTNDCPSSIISIIRLRVSTILISKTRSRQTLCENEDKAPGTLGFGLDQARFSSKCSVMQEMTDEIHLRQSMMLVSNLQYPPMGHQGVQHLCKVTHTYIQCIPDRIEAALIQKGHGDGKMMNSIYASEST